MATLHIQKTYTYTEDDIVKLFDAVNHAIHQKNCDIKEVHKHTLDAIQADADKHSEYAITRR